MATTNIDKKKYGGKYVATKSFTSKKVVAFGKDPEKVYEDAIKQGILEPVINYICQENMVCIY